MYWAGETLETLGGAGLTHCNSSGKAVTGSGSDAPGWTFQRTATGATCTYGMPAPSAPPNNGGGGPPPGGDGTGLFDWGYVDLSGAFTLATGPGFTVNSYRDNTTGGTIVGLTDAMHNPTSFILA